MVRLYDGGVYYSNGEIIPDDTDGRRRLESAGISLSKESAKRNTMAYSILEQHNTSGGMEDLKIKFDCMASHDITYVGIIQTARASGLDSFPLPYVLTNCHNSLCAVGGTINSDDHAFGLSAAMRYGGIFVPAHQAVIHQYMREMMSGCGKMIIGSDSHTRYGALGTLAIGEGGGELAKQLLGKTYDIPMPEVVGVYLTGKPRPGIGPQDVALAIVGAVFANGYVKNKIMEFIGDGIKNLSVDFRNGIDVMTTETTCLSSIWETDALVQDYYELHGHKESYKQLRAGHMPCYYDGFIYIDLSKIESMIAMPFHPANVYTINELNENTADIINKIENDAKKQLDKPKVKFSLRDRLVNGRLTATQGVIAGCAGGTFENICDAADILNGSAIGGTGFTLSVYPSSQPVFIELMKNGAAAGLMSAGAVMRSAICGPCFGAGDVPSNNGLSVRHSTRNFPNREGSRPSDGQTASVALMDARSVAATALNKGFLTAATDIDISFTKPKYYFNQTVYKNTVYNGYGKADSSVPLRLAPSIADWPEMPALTDNLLLKVTAYITDPVTTTDELIPSGETSSYRSNPMKLAEFTLSRKVPEYVGKVKAVHGLELARRRGEDVRLLDEEIDKVLEQLGGKFDIDISSTGIGSVIYAVKPGDGSAREQAASCQRVLGGCANIANEYATKRYRSNLINWGMLPFTIKERADFKCGEYVYIPGIRRAIEEGAAELRAYYSDGDELKEIMLGIGGMTPDERQIILAGCLINYYR